LPSCEPSSGTGVLARGTVVLGIGNLLRADDGVGVHVAHELIARRCLDGVTVLDGGVAPLDALAHAGPMQRLIIVDAANLGEAPGTIRALSPDALAPHDGDGVSLHDLDLLWALSVMRATGEEPPETVIIGVQPACLDWSTELSPAVAARLDDIVEAVLAEIPARDTGREKVRP
jgi:hydrogenase maturation protease